MLVSPVTAVYVRYPEASKMPGPETLRTQDNLASRGARAPLEAALAVLVLYVVSLIALGTLPAAFDSGQQVASPCTIDLTPSL